jgi:hypothetical protein
MASRDRYSEVKIVKGSTSFAKFPRMSKNAIQLTEFGNSVLKQGYLLFRGLIEAWFFGILLLVC